MDEKTRKILLLVEGAKTDVAIMKHLLSIYQLDIHYEIVSYNTNIYTLYHEMFEENEPEDIDFLQMLKSREVDLEKQRIFDDIYSDILLIFDLDPQAPDFSMKKILRMADYFVESSDMGKLYLNYPMVEAFYHMKEIPDPDFNSYYSSLQELSQGKYKSRVNRENRNHDYRKFAVTKEECNIVIRQNITKARNMVRKMSNDSQNCENNNSLPMQADILTVQLENLNNKAQVAVLSTCPFFIPEYNPALLE